MKPKQQVKIHVDIPTYDKVVFAAMSKRNFFLREHIIKHILEQGYTPTCAFMMFSYYLLDTVDRQALISANNGLIKKSDELWVYGSASDGVFEEMKLARTLRLPLRFFKIKQPECHFMEIAESELQAEC